MNEKRRKSRGLLKGDDRLRFLLSILCVHRVKIVHWHEDGARMFQRQGKGLEIVVILKIVPL